MNLKDMDPYFLAEAVQAAHRARQQLLTSAQKNGQTSDVEVLGAFRDFDAFLRGVIPAPRELVDIIENRLEAAIKLAARGIVSSRVRYRSSRKLLVAEAGKIIRETLENLLPYDPKKLAEYYEQFPGVFIESQLSGRLTDTLRETIREAYYRARELQLKDEIDQCLAAQWRGFRINDVVDGLSKLDIASSKTMKLQTLLLYSSSEMLPAAVEHLVRLHDEIANDTDKMLTAGREIAEYADFLSFVVAGILPELRT